MDYSRKDILNLRQNSIERVLNTALKLAEHAMESKNERISELGGISQMDITELKELVVRLWDNARNETWSIRT